MKLQYLGTAAAERVPALFCHCSVCTYAREHGGKEIRTQSQSLLDDGDLLIDFPGDSYLHALQQQVDYSDLENLLITHWHSDHFYGEDLAFRMKGYGNALTNQLTVYGSGEVEKFFNRAFELEGRKDEERITFRVLKPYETYLISHYLVLPLPAQHGLFQEDSFIYALQDQTSGKSLFYTHDTGLPLEKDLDFLAAHQWQFDLVSLDCTEQKREKSGGTHMVFADNLCLIEKLKARHLVSDQTVYVANHFSHNGGLTHEEMVKLGESQGIQTAYDGFVVEV